MTGATYTAFCRQNDNVGTTWIGTVEAESTEQAMRAARQACAADWEWSVEKVVCIGLASGNVEILHWEDIV